MANGLRAVGPPDPVHGFPLWYEDSDGTRLELGLDPTDPNLPALELPTPGAPVAFPDNFPDEAFYFTAEAEMLVGGPAGTTARARLILALEAAFEVGRPVGMRPGTPITAPFALNLGPQPLIPGTRYEWRLTVDGETREDWRVEVELNDLVGVYSRPEDRVVLVVYAARITAGDPRPTPEAPEIRAFAPGEIPWDELAFWSTDGVSPLFVVEPGLFRLHVGSTLDTVQAVELRVR